MFSISAIGNKPNYRVNPIYMEYAQKYKKACTDFAMLDKKIKNSNKPREIDSDARQTAKVAKKKFENLCQTTSKILEGCDKTKEQATEQAGKLHKLDYYC